MTVFIMATGDGLAPGQWRRSPNGFVWVRCPHPENGRCSGHTCLIVRGDPKQDWEIADDGTVSPSLEIMNPDCGFHDHIKLEGWAKR